MSIILMSIKPKYVNKIFSLEKRYEYRKKIPKDKIDKIIVYSTFPVQRVVGELYIKQVLYDNKNIVWNNTYQYSGISKEEYDKYYNNCNMAVAYEIDKVIIYDSYKYLSDYGIKIPPQSFVYIK